MFAFRSQGRSLTVSEARLWQQEMAARVITHDDFTAIKTIAGVDVGFEKQGTVTRAGVAVLHFPALDLVDYAIARQPTCMPYIPGLLSFRECPAIVPALESLSYKPDLLLCDGQGLAHPRRFGVACHIGVLTGIPSIGIAKKRLCGTHDPVAEEKGSTVPLQDKDERIGTVLRSRSGIKPVYVSIGHRISLATAEQIVQSCLKGYKLPEPIRWADALASSRGKAVEYADRTLGRL